MGMVVNGLGVGVLETVGFGWISAFLMLICLYVWKGDFKSSYNYRPKWAQMNIPEDEATKMDKEGAKWMVYAIGVLWCAIIIGWVYSIVSGDYNHLSFILLGNLIGWAVLFLAVTLVFYIKAYFAEKKHKTNKN
jgi:hypothetical protein